MTFNNADLFIPAGAVLDEVIAKDKTELQTIGGSFSDIADRMDYLIFQIDHILAPQLDKEKDKIFRDHGYNAEDYWRIPPTEREAIQEAITSLYNQVHPITEEGDIGVVSWATAHGEQRCPFSDCEDVAENAEYVIINIASQRQLTINLITSHLARAHSLLEKGNQFGISASDFYEYFMIH